jgi:hypothetical protein
MLLRLLLLGLLCEAMDARLGSQASLPARPASCSCLL